MSVQMYCSYRSITAQTTGSQASTTVRHGSLLLLSLPTTLSLSSIDNLGLAPIVTLISTEPKYWKLSEKQILHQWSPLPDERVTSLYCYYWFIYTLSKTDGETWHLPALIQLPWERQYCHYSIIDLMYSALSFTVRSRLSWEIFLATSYFISIIISSPVYKIYLNENSDVASKIPVLFIKAEFF